MAFPSAQIVFQDAVFFQQLRTSLIVTDAGVNMADNNPAEVGA